MLRLFQLAGPKTRIALALVVGVLALAGGYYRLHDGDVSCGEDPLTGNQTCVLRPDAVTTDQPLAERYDAQRREGYALLAVGGVLTVTGVVLATRFGQRDRRRPATRTAATS